MRAFARPLTRCLLKARQSTRSPDSWTGCADPVRHRGYAQTYRRLWSELAAVHAAAHGNGEQQSPSTPQIRAAQNAEAMLRTLYERDSGRIEADVRSNIRPDHEPRGASSETIASIYRMLGVKGLADAQRRR